MSIRTLPAKKVPRYLLVIFNASLQFYVLILYLQRHAMLLVGVHMGEKRMVLASNVKQCIIVQHTTRIY